MTTTWGDHKWNASAARDSLSGQSLCLIRLSGLQEREVTAAIAAYETHGWVLDQLTATELLLPEEEDDHREPPTVVTTYHVLFRKASGD